MKTIVKLAAIVSLCAMFATSAAVADSKKEKIDDPLVGIATFVESVVMLPIKAVEELSK